MNTLTVEELAKEIHLIDDISPEFAMMIATGLLPFIQSRAAGVQGEAGGPLSSRLRPDVECAPWVIEEVKKLERRLATPQPPKDAGAVPAAWRESVTRAIERARVFDDGTDGADAESARSVVAILAQLIAASHQHPPAEPETTAADNDLVQVERGLLGAACSAIAKKRDAPKVLEALRKITMTPRAELADSLFVGAVKKLVIAARTSGGTAGRDDGLCAALDAVEAMLVEPAARAQAARVGRISRRQSTSCACCYSCAIPKQKPSPARAPLMPARGNDDEQSSRNRKTMRPAERMARVSMVFCRAWAEMARKRWRTASNGRIRL